MSWSPSDLFQRINWCSEYTMYGQTDQLLNWNPNIYNCVDFMFASRKVIDSIQFFPLISLLVRSIPILQMPPPPAPSLTDGQFFFPIFFISILLSICDINI